MHRSVQEGATSRFQLWPDPGVAHTLGTEGWLVNLHVTRARGARRWPWFPDPVLIVGNPTMSQVWEATYVSPEDEIRVELLAPARVLRRDAEPPAWIARPAALAPGAVTVWAEVLTAEAILRLGRAALDTTTLLGQPRYEIPGTWSA